jgi:hypothetical protein
MKWFKAAPVLFWITVRVRPDRFGLNLPSPTFHAGQSPIGAVALVLVGVIPHDTRQRTAAKSTWRGTYPCETHPLTNDQLSSRDAADDAGSASTALS